jgi:pyrimidine-nucleoside phosphorylase
MSKKIAAGAHAIVLDVKAGSGAFMKTQADAVALAEAMVWIGRGTGRRLSAVISDMEQPLGCAVGNALEVREAIDTLQGRGPDDFTEHCIVVATEMVLLADRCSTAEEGRAILLQAIESGKAIAKFREWMRAQGGNDAVVDDAALMQQASLQADLPSPQNGYIEAINAMEVGLATVALGAGRLKKGDPIDHAVGAVLNKKVGDHVQEGESLLTIHANAEQRLADARNRLLSAYRWSDAPVAAPPLIRSIIH